MAWSSLPMRLNRRRTSPMVSPIRRRRLLVAAGLASCSDLRSFLPSGVFAPSGGLGCPQAAGPLFRCVSHDCEEGEGEHRHGDMPVPCAVEAHLVVVQSGFAFRGLERLLYRPAHSRGPDEFTESFSPRVIAVIVGELAVIDRAADHVLAARMT